jgi:antirestriction protein ArdC
MNKNYEIITDRIKAELESGRIPWRREWSTVNCEAFNFKSKSGYRGVNWVLLNMALSFQIPAFVTFKQAKELGAPVKKGESGCPIFFFTKWKPKGAAEDDRELPVLRRYTVFNVAQLENEGRHLEGLPELKKFDWSPVAAAERLLELTRHQLPIKPGGICAYYPDRHEITMTAADTFENANGYYATLFHELIHSTMTPLKRKQAAKMGDSTYAKEELIAELGAAFLCAACGIDNQDIRNRAAYVQGWLKHLDNDPKLFYQAASQAQKAADLILEGIDLDTLRQPSKQPTSELIPAEEIPFNLASEERPDPAPALESARRSAQVETSQLSLF